MGKASQFNFRSTAIAPFGQYNVQCFRCLDGILSKGFVEIPDSEKKQRIRIIGFHPIVLLH